MPFDESAVQEYLSGLLGGRVKVVGVTPIGELPDGDPIKSYGYGRPLRVDYIRAGQDVQSAVLHTMGPSPFGHEHMADRAQILLWSHHAFNALPRHEHMADRAQILLWSHHAFNALPRHARSLDVGASRKDGVLVPLGTAEEFFLLTEYAEGKGYNRDLDALRDTDVLRDLDVARADALCNYLIEIHRGPGAESGLYARRIRELVGHGECIMGLTDSYPPHPLFPSSLLEEIEHLCVKWRWRLKGRAHRLRQVHGDFHPWNILFEDASTDFHVLDRSRGEWGDPADDVSSITSNYLFFSLQRHGCLKGALRTLFERFWQRYLAGSQDREMLEVVAPFFAFRGLVMASPVWYPSLPDEIRGKLLRFILAVLKEERFDPGKANEYLDD